MNDHECAKIRASEETAFPLLRAAAADMRGVETMRDGWIFTIQHTDLFGVGFGICHRRGSDGWIPGLPLGVERENVLHSAEDALRRDGAPTRFIPRGFGRSN